MNQNGFFGSRSSSQSMMINLLILHAVIYLFQSLLAPRLGLPLVGGQIPWVDYHLGLHALGDPDFRLYQLVTYMFLHANFEHLFFNMFTLWMFGRVLEYDLGRRRFLIFYLVCGIGAGLCNLGANWVMHSYGLTVGASGAIYGILLSFGLMHPNERIMLLIPPIPMKAKYFVLVFGVIELLMGILGSRGLLSDHVAHFAHLGGMLFGWLLLVGWKRRGKIHY